MSDMAQGYTPQHGYHCHSFRSSVGEPSLRDSPYENLNSSHDYNFPAESFLPTSHEFNFHSIYSLSPAPFLVRRVRCPSLLRPFTPRLRGHVHRARCAGIFIRTGGLSFRRYVHRIPSRATYTPTQPISTSSAPTSLLPALTTQSPGYSAISHVDSGALDESTPKDLPRVQETMPPGVKAFGSRVRTFIKLLPQLWASTHSANDSYTASTTPDTRLPGGYANSSESRNRLLFDMDKLDIPHHHRALFLAVNQVVLEYMSGAQYDPSHDYEHIQRVVKYTHELYTEEKTAGRVPLYLDLTTMYLAAMMHDVGETKYLEKGRTQEDVVTEKMLQCGASPALAHAVATIAVNVSYTREKTAVDRTLIHAIIERHPELAFVQDADRLDAIGPSGQARCFVYGGANSTRRGQSIHTGVQLHHTRFQYYVGMMKTRAGRVRAETKWRWMSNFRREWGQDTDVRSVV